MRKTLALVALVPALASAQGVSRPQKQGEEMLAYRAIGGVVAVATYEQVVLPADRAFFVTAVTARTTAAASGAGTVTWRVSDGTNNCDCSGACLTNGATGYGDAGGKRIACTGTCSFAPGAALTLSISASSCVSTQPNVQGVQIRGKWL